jgi:hypothetical protein
MNDSQTNEIFATGLSKIRHEIKSHLASRGLYGTVTIRDLDSASASPGVNIDIAARGKVASRSFELKQIEGCHLRVSGAVLAAVVAMIEELAA